MAEKIKELDGLKKSAILLVLLGPERASKILKKLDEEEVEQLTLEIANLEKIDEKTKTAVLDEFREYVKAKDYINTGGVEYARNLLEKTFGPEKAIDIIDRLVSNLQVKPFEFLRKVDVSQMVNVLQNEHPQTVALILCYLSPQAASQIISELPESLQLDVIKRISTMDSANPDIVKEIESRLKDRLSAFTVQTFSQVGGIDVTAEIMNNIDRAISNNIFEKLSERDPKLSDEIRRRMFVFEDIVKLDDRSIQRILREVDSKDLTMALKGSSEEVKNVIFKNMSKRASQIIKEELDFMGPVRVRDVDEAQQRIINVIRKLEESGEIIISGGGAGEELIE
ncbi:flagellar motor switch protein FliG [Petrotoga olearia]|uniref:Flagellar motor switch protein FliG n=2 Tax=Petrotoga olearia TaxID=156203 RepID=A0A2K1P2B5_9BACT|nr:flagellar motor switch protein FliG [Petrotoga olearia]PNR96928.1 flagellar motor switch protein FliG [Petrotoga olearia DSM 13574]RMA70564.1 flagellar motor switch protein FliG [Petrotoga olearia]